MAIGRLYVARDFTPYDQAKALGAKCDLCPLRENGTIVLAPLRKQTKRLMTVVGEAPGADEVVLKRFFVGKSGELMDAIYERLGIRKSELHITNAVLCRPNTKLGPKEWRAAISCCSTRLQRELPHSGVVLALGEKAQLALTGKSGIMKWMGAEMPAAEALKRPRLKVLSTVHPAFVLRSSQYNPVLAFHVERAFRLATKELPDWKWPNIAIKTRETDYITQTLVTLSKDRVLGLDVETAGIDPLEAPLLNVGIAGVSGALSIRWNVASESEKTFVKALLLDGSKTFIVQNGQFDAISLATHGLEVKGQLWDTMVAHAVVANRLPHNLGFIATCEYHAPRWKELFRVASDEPGAKRFETGDPDVVADYNAKDAWMQFMLSFALQERLLATHRGHEQFDALMRLIPEVVAMRTQGVRVNPEAMLRHRKKLRSLKTKARNQLIAAASRLRFKGFNPESSRHVKKIFLKKLKVDAVRWKKEPPFNPSFDEKALQQYVTHRRPSVSFFAQEMLRYREVKKLLEYVDGLDIDASGYIHPIWNPAGTRTGRWSSQGPNMMNIPKIMRDMFQAAPGKTLVSADLKQAELRVVALLSGDQALLEACTAADPHAANAKRLFGTYTYTDAQRDMGKKFTHAANYGAADETMWAAMVIHFPALTLTDIKRMRIAWFKACPKIVKWQKTQEMSARLNDYVEEPLSGRRMYFFGKVKPSEAINFAPQACVAEIMNRAALRILARLDPQTERLWNQVHDDIVLEGPDALRLAKILDEEMARPVLLNGNEISIPVDLKVGPIWGNMKKFKCT